MTILAIDYGDSRTGIALSDPLGFMAGRSFVIREKKLDQLICKLVDIISLEKPSELVLGFPKNMNNTEGERAEKSRELKKVLEEKTGLPVILWDERTTTISAHQILSANGKRHRQHRQTVDAVAASLILEGYLRFKSMQS